MPEEEGREKESALEAVTAPCGDPADEWRKRAGDRSDEGVEGTHALHRGVNDDVDRDGGEGEEGGAEIGEEAEDRDTSEGKKEAEKQGIAR